MKKWKAFACLLGATCLLAGCSPNDVSFNPDKFTLNFRYFLSPNTKSLKSIKLDEIDLKADTMSLEKIESMDKKLKEMYQTCADETYYYNNFNNNEMFHSSVLSNFTEDAKSSLQKESGFKKSIDYIYEKQNTTYYDCNITAVKQNTNQTYFEAEVIAVDYSKKFLVEYINVYTDEQGKIKKIELLDELKHVENTTKPLSKDSLLDKKNIHSSFEKTWHSFLDSLRNKKLYQKYAMALQGSTETKESEEKITVEEMELQLDTLMDTVATSELKAKNLKKFFIDGEGSFDNIVISKYQINDYDGLAKSIYTVQLVSNNKLCTYDVTFDRIESKIIKLEKKTE